MKEQNRHIKAANTFIGAAIKELVKYDCEISIKIIEDNTDLYKLGIETGKIELAKTCLRMVKNKLI